MNDTVKLVIVSMWMATVVMALAMSLVGFGAWWFWYTIRVATGPEDFLLFSSPFLVMIWIYFAYDYWKFAKKNDK